MLIRSNNYSIRKISIDQLEDVHRLCIKCDDYFKLCEGESPTIENAKDIFESIPKTNKYKDKIVFGIYEEEEIIGVIDIIKNYPIKSQWIIGLFMIEKNKRNSGIGKYIHKLLEKYCNNNGATLLRVAVVKDNLRAINFWGKLGYKKINESEIAFGTTIKKLDVMTLDIKK